MKQRFDKRNIVDVFVWWIIPFMRINCFDINNIQTAWIKICWCKLYGISTCWTLHTMCCLIDWDLFEKEIQRNDYNIFTVKSQDSSMIEAPHECWLFLRSDTWKYFDQIFLEIFNLFFTLFAKPKMEIPRFLHPFHSRLLTE